MSHVDEGPLHAYLDGELPSAERTALESHLADCATCRANLAEERALRERAVALFGSTRPAERPAPPFDQLRREPKRSPWRVRRSFAWAASIAVALGLGYYMRSPNSYMRSSSPRPAAQTPAQPVAIAQPPAPATAETKPARGTRNAARPADKLARVTPTAEASGAAADTMRVDANMVSGAVAAERDRAAAPAPNLYVDGAPRRQLTTTWPVITRRAAKSILGEEPVGLPDLAARTFRRVPGTDSTIVVEQVLDSSTVIQIFQRPAGGAYPYDSSTLGAADQGRSRPRGYAREEQSRSNRLFARFVRGLRVEITGPLSADSLNRLLDQVAPLPPLP